VLDVRAEGVLADRAVGSHDAVAWDEDRDRIVAQCRADGPNGTRVVDLTRDPPVRSDLTKGNRCTGGQH
jgi:hypothetical protein